MKTKQLYLDNPYLKEMDAEILEFLPDGEGRYRLMLDGTVFYPMGGGQATDQGKLEGENWSGEVYQVLNREGEIWHFVKSSSAPLVGMKVHGLINWDRRYRNMKLHSAGHIIDFAMHLLGYSPKILMPVKGEHDKNPHIIYQGIAGEDFRQDLEDKANELVRKNLKFSWYFQPLKTLEEEAIYLQLGLPVDKPLRTLKLEGVGAVADGGTQVKETGEVGSIKITSVEKKDSLTKISYELG